MFPIDSEFYFRKLERSDLDQLKHLKDETWIYNHNTVILNFDDQIKWFESLDKNTIQPKNLILVLCGKSEFLGVFKLFDIDWINQSVNVGWDIIVSQRGFGYGHKIVCGGKEFCFNKLNLRKLNCEILSNNEASIKCALKAGFLLEGVKRESVYKEGVYLDSHVYSVLKSHSELTSF